jgi:hypothetical protein
LHLWEGVEEVVTVDVVEVFEVKAILVDPIYKCVK